MKNLRLFILMIVAVSLTAMSVRAQQLPNGLNNAAGGVDNTLNTARQACQTAQNPASLLPAIPGLQHIQEILNIYREMTNGLQTAMRMPLDDALRVADLVSRYSPQALIGKIRDIMNKIPGGNNMTAAGIVGAMFSELQGILQNPRLNAELGKLYEKLINEYNKLKQEAESSAMSELEKQKAYQKLQKMRGTIEGLHKRIQDGVGGVVGELETANNELNAALESSPMGKTMGTLTDVISSYQNGTIFGKIETLVQKIKAISNTINTIRDQIRQLCGMLPNGSVRDQMLKLRPDVLNGKIEGILNEMLREAERELMKKVSGFIDNKLGPLGGLAKGPLQGLINNLTDILKGALMGKLREAFWSLVDPNGMGKIKSQTACQTGQAMYGAVNNAAHEYVEAELQKRSHGKVQGFWNTPNIVKCQ